MSEVFVLTDARRASSRGVIGSTMDAYSRGTGSNPVEGNGHFFSLILSALSSSFFHTDLRTQRRSLQTPGGSRGPADRSSSVSLCMLVFHDRAGGECLKCLFRLT